MRRDQRGSITPLVIGLATVVALLVVVVVDASAGYLTRENLNATADAAALAATDGVQGELAYTAGLDDDLAVDPELAHRYVAQYLDMSGAAQRYQDLTWSVLVDGRRVTVRLRARSSLPLHLPGAPESVVVSAAASAVLHVAR